MKDQMTHAEAVSLLAEKEEEIERLRKDEKRLDWLADKNNTVGNVTLPTACVMRNLHSLRAAIDDAMLKTANARSEARPACGTSRSTEELDGCERKDDET